MVFLFYKENQSRKSQVHVKNPNTSKHNAQWLSGQVAWGRGTQ